MLCPHLDSVRAEKWESTVRDGCVVPELLMVIEPSWCKVYRVSVNTEEGEYVRKT